jgi:hypothetical protein
MRTIAVCTSLANLEALAAIFEIRLAVQTTISQPPSSHSNAITSPRLLNIPHLPPRHLQPHTSTSTPTTLILNRLPLPNPKCFPLTLPINPPLRLKCNTRIPAPDFTLNRTPIILRFKNRRRLAVESGLTACGCDDIFPQVSARS